VTRIQPEGGVQVVAERARTAVVAVSVGNPVTVSTIAVGVPVGKLCGKVGGICVGVEAGGRDSARDKKIPPMTSTTETMATITPTPS
jgi:hypothetical protein